MNYLSTLSKEQLEVIQKATDLFVRIQLGQWREILELLPLQENIDYGELHKDANLIGEFLSKYLISNVNGLNSSLGVGHPDLPETNSIALDISNTIRHRLSWDKAKDEKIVESDSSPRDLSKMFGVNYDTPMNWSEQPLPTFTRID